jgi:hypothetical protein
MYNSGYQVAPLTREAIRQESLKVRQEADAFNGESSNYFDIVKYLDIVLPSIEPRFCLEICSMSEMGDNHGLTIPSDHLIRIREDIFAKACNGSGRDRMTLAHELGHYKLHGRVAFPRAWKHGIDFIPRYKNSEWQADCFGGELLMSFGSIDECVDVFEIMKVFGVSYEAAAYHSRQVKN